MPKPKLNPNARKWVRALRSGKYKQGKDALEKIVKGESRFCCLGVACDLYIKSGKRLKRDLIPGGEIQYGGRAGVLPEKVMEWIGLADSTGSFDKTSLATMNDEGKRFTAIAKIIESKPEGLFK